MRTVLAGWVRDAWQVVRHPLSFPPIDSHASLSDALTFTLVAAVIYGTGNGVLFASTLLPPPLGGPALFGLPPTASWAVSVLGAVMSAVAVAAVAGLAALFLLGGAVQLIAGRLDGADWKTSVVAVSAGAPVVGLVGWLPGVVFVAPALAVFPVIAALEHGHGFDRRDAILAALPLILVAGAVLRVGADAALAAL